MTSTSALIEYTTASPLHLRAAIVGILNTLLVAVLACFLRQRRYLGSLAGVLRLSNNWLVSKLMAFYVEIFRNIPVLIWLLIIFTIMTAVLPGPRAFRGDEPEASMLFNAFAFTNRGIYTPLPYFERGFGGGLDFLLVLVLLVGSFFAARAVTARATRIQEATGERPATC